VLGECVGVCHPGNGNSDCSRTASAVCDGDGVLLPLDNGTLAVAKVCWGRECNMDSDCTNNHKCAEDPDPTNPNKTVKHCRPR